MIEGAGAIAASERDAETVRIENFVPRYGCDITEHTLPQETQQMHALHFQKGCYLGQEIVERIRSRGNVHRHLRSMELDGPLPARGTELMFEGAAAGQITSAAVLPVASGSRVFALGMVRATAEVEDKPLKYGAENETGTARILATPPNL